MPLIKPETGVELLQYQALGPVPLYLDNSRGYFEDFTVSATSYTWTFSTSLTGNTRIFESTPTSGRPGVVTIRVGTSTTAACTQTASSLATPNFLVPSGAWVLEAAIRLGQLSDATNNFTYEFGLLNQTGATGAPTIGAWFSYNHALNAGNWTANSGGSVQSATDTGVAADTNWHVLKIEGSGSSALAFYIDDVQVASNTTAAQIPANTDALTIHAPRMRKSAGTVTRDSFIDYFFMGWSLTSPR